MCLDKTVLVFYICHLSVKRQDQYPLCSEPFYWPFVCCNVIKGSVLNNRLCLI